jgi:hypothetical protein
MVLWLLEVVVEGERTHSAFRRGDQRRDPVKFLSVIALEICFCLSYHDWRCVRGGVGLEGLDGDVV